MSSQYLSAPDIEIKISTAELQRRRLTPAYSCVLLPERVASEKSFTLSHREAEKATDACVVPCCVLKRASPRDGSKQVWEDGGSWGGEGGGEGREGS